MGQLGQNQVASFSSQERVGGGGCSCVTADPLTYCYTHDPLTTTKTHDSDPLTQHIVDLDSY